MVNQQFSIPLGKKMKTTAKAIGFQTHNSASHTRKTARLKTVALEKPGHLATFAPTGSGKGVGCVNPTALTYEGSMVILDIKGEISAVTYKQRIRLGHEVVVLDAFKYTSFPKSSLNLFDLCSNGNESIEESSEEFAELLAVKGIREPFWDISATSLVSAIIAAVACTEPPEKRNMRAVAKYLLADDPVYSLAVLLDTHGKKLPESSYKKIAAFLNLPERDTRPSVLGTAVSYINTLLSSSVLEATQSTSFDLDKLRQGKPITIYLVIPPEKVKSHRRLINLWVSLLLKVILSRRVVPEMPTLFVLDEVGQLGKFPLLEPFVTLCRGYGAFVWLIYQDFSQLTSSFPSSWQTLCNNLAAIQFFKPNSPLAHKQLADFTGLDRSTIADLRSDEQLLLLNGECHILRKLNYLHDSEYRGKFESNPFYRGFSSQNSTFDTIR